MRDIKGLVTRLKSNQDEALYQATASFRDDIMEEWLKGQGGDGKPLKQGSTAYLKRKQATGRRAIIDLNMTGDLAKSMSVRVSNQGGEVFFIDTRGRGKATNNEVINGIKAIRPNAMKVSNKIISRASAVYRKKLF